MLDLNDIVVFARVVEAGSFTAAARLLGMPKTTVSRRIAALEREVGVRLIQRTTRSLNMTDAGRLYYEQSSQALRTIEEANLRLAEARAEPSGTILISAPVGFAGHFHVCQGRVVEPRSRRLHDASWRAYAVYPSSRHVRLWSRNSSSLQPSDWPPPGPARMTRL
jgi:DNA-binding transcriptional LysR family regulator